eukprot:TRINITY_DN1018_c0_g1_i4.p1 TRINITY_DN1018_c0_g1~~TRINITY_DN1018_c0_g1_i4.p1  ORF type:complete len:161 (-),score=15.10 TRINITY_DN1018_c0_g1_i4:40-522(-)
MHSDHIDLTAARLLKNDNKEGYTTHAAPMEHEYKTFLQHCQVKSFQENIDLKKAESAAQQCFKPYLKLQKQSLAELSPVKRKFESCMRRNIRHIDEESMSRNTVFQECLTQYKRDIPRYNARSPQPNLGKLCGTILFSARLNCTWAVSYTHLTLPTTPYV